MLYDNYNFLSELANYDFVIIDKIPSVRIYQNWHQQEDTEVVFNNSSGNSCWFLSSLMAAGGLSTDSCAFFGLVLCASSFRSLASSVHYSRSHIAAIIWRNVGFPLTRRGIERLFSKAFQFSYSVTILVYLQLDCGFPYIFKKIATKRIKGKIFTCWKFIF